MNTQFQFLSRIRVAKKLDDLFASTNPTHISTYDEWLKAQKPMFDFLDANHPLNNYSSHIAHEMPRNP
jgi:hypothetical protein